MPDLLTHVLVAYSVATVLSVRYKWITPPLTTVSMAGGIIPDLSKFRRLVSGETIEAILGIPFTWVSFHTFGGTGIILLIACLTVRPEYRQPVVLLLLTGVLSHFVLDMFLVPPDGTFPYLWPLTDATIALPGVYKSGDPWLIPVAALLALGIQAAVHHRSLERDTSLRIDG